MRKHAVEVTWVNKTLHVGEGLVLCLISAAIAICSGWLLLKTHWLEEEQ